MKKVTIDPAIFGDYDIRGIYPTQINEKIFYLIGKAIATYLDVDQIAVGRDMRLSSPTLAQAVIKGLRSLGVDIVDLGLISTEMHYFASGKYQFPANIIVSASHNPANYNGLKIVTKGVIPLNGEFGLPEIKKILLSQDFKKSKRKGRLIKKRIMDDWIKHVLSFVNFSSLRPIKVVIDAGNGMGGISWQKLIDKLPIKIFPMNFNPDGNFPAHLPDPLKKENIADLQKEVLRKKADIGFALDGDADRLFVLDEKGRTISGTIATAMLASFLLSQNGPSTILYNVVCGRIVPETIRKYHGVAIPVRVGHSFIKRYMKKYRALFAGEHSGHFYFQKNYNADSSLIAGLIFLEYLSEKNKPLSILASEFDKYYESGEINFKVNNSRNILLKLKKYFSNASSIAEIDGLSVVYADWWFNLRASKTEPLLRLNLESRKKNLVKAKVKEIEKLIKKLNK